MLTSRWAEATLSQSQTFTPANGTIADGNPVGSVFTGTFSQTGFSGPISTVSIGLNISGGYNGDLYAYLVAPNGTVVLLLNQPGSGAFGSAASGFGNGTANSFELTSSGTSIQTVDGTAWQTLTGSYQAAGNLNDFAASGATGNGNWTLFFADLSSGGGNSYLNNWTLNLTVVPEPVLLALITFIAMLLALAGLKWAWQAQSCKKCANLGLVNHSTLAGKCGNMDFFTQPSHRDFDILS